MTVQKHDVVAGGGVLSGLLVAFLPLLQALPGHVSAGTVQTAVAAGATVILGSLGYHGVVTKAQTAKVSTFMTQSAPEVESAVAQFPAVQQAAHDASVLAATFETRVKALEAGSSPAIPALADAVLAEIGKRHQ